MTLTTEGAKTMSTTEKNKAPEAQSRKDAYLLQAPAGQRGIGGRIPRYSVEGGELIGQIRIGVFNSARWRLASGGFWAHNQLRGDGAGDGYFA